MVANYLKEYFIKRGISQYEVSKKTKITRDKLSLSLNGKRKLTAEELILIAKIYDIDLNKIKDIK